MYYWFYFYYYYYYYYYFFSLLFISVLGLSIDGFWQGGFFTFPVFVGVREPRKVNSKQHGGGEPRHS